MLGFLFGLLIGVLGATIYFVIVVPAVGAHLLSLFERKPKA